MNCREQLKKHTFNILLLLLLCSIIFTAIELLSPFYFTMDDNENAFLYFYKYAYDALSKGDIAFYCFNHFLGAPFFSAGQTGTLNPVIMLCGFFCDKILGNFAYTIESVAYVHLLISSVGMYFVIRSLFNKSYLAVAGGLAWAFCTFNVFIGRSWIIVIIISSVVPYVFLGTKYLYENLSIKGIAISIIPKVIMFYCGHPQFFIWGMIFDFLTVLLYFVWAGEKNKQRLKFVLYYILGFIPVLFLSLPILIPMWRCMSMSSTRSDALSFEIFSSFSSDPVLALIAQINPFSEMGCGDVYNMGFVRFFCGHYTYIFISLFYVGLVLLLFQKERKKISSIYIISLISVMVSSSELVSKIIYFIPVLNRFRWPFKYMLWFPFFSIIASIYAATFIIEKIKRYGELRKYKNVFSAFLVTATVINIIVVSIFSPINYWGFKMQGNNINAPENLNSLYESNRYLNVGYYPDSSTIGKYPKGDDIFKMQYNIALYYNFSNVSGYDVLTPDGSANRLKDVYRFDFKGCVFPDSADFIYQLNYLGTDTLILDKNWLGVDSKKLVNCNLEEVYEGEDYIVARNLDALPVVRTLDGEPVAYEQKTNSLTLQTSDDFAGGDILIMFSYDPDFCGYINGEKTEIFENDYYTMRINAPKGANKIDINYSTDAFNYSCISAVLGTVTFFGIGVLINKCRFKTV